jgi:outer membrane protein assembly factor BamD (BamD/ComL family)
MLAKKQLYIADFYFKHEKWLSALRRYEGATKMPAPEEVTTKAYLNGAISALEIGEVEKGKELLDQLSKKVINGDTSNRIKNIKSKYGI